MGHFIPLNLTSVAIFSPAWSNMKAVVEVSLTVRVKGASSFSYKAVASGPCSIQRGSAG